VVGGLEQQVQRIVPAVDLAGLQRRDRLVVHLLVLLVIGRRLARRRRRPAQWLVAADGAARGQRLGEVGGAVCAHDADGLGQLAGLGAHALPAIAHLVVVDDLLKLVVVVGLPLAARRREEALLALAPAAHTGRVVGVVLGKSASDSGASGAAHAYGSKVAAHLAPATGNARLVGACVRRLRPSLAKWRRSARHVSWGDGVETSACGGSAAR
jgi:hypothetical protein